MHLKNLSLTEVAKISMAKIQVNPIQPEDLAHELPVAQPEEPDSDFAVADTAREAPAAEDATAKAKRDRDELLDRLARLQAEFENYRKRSQREQLDFKEYAIAEAVRSLLPALDSLDLALKTAAQAQSELRAGLELTARQFQDALGKLGLREVTAQGAAFDPQLHQAVEMVPRKDLPDHQVLEVLQKGYQLKDRLLRPAMVRLVSNPRK